jgi:hypothetical protein
MKYKKRHMDKKNATQLIIKKMLEPKEILERVKFEYVGLDIDGSLLGTTSSLVPSVNFPGKQWVLIGGAILIELVLERLLGAAFGGPWLVFEIASLAIDIIDPYGYSTTLDRGTINEKILETISQVTASLKLEKQNIIDEVFPTLSASGISREAVEQLVDTLTDYWTVAIPSPPKECYGDLATFKTLSGPPTDKCNIIYNRSYEDYLNTNGDIYVKTVTPENKEEIKLEMDKAFSKIFDFIIDTNLKTYKKDVVGINLIGLGLITLAGLIIFTIIKIKNKKKE